RCSTFGIACDDRPGGRGLLPLRVARCRLAAHGARANGPNPLWIGVASGTSRGGTLKWSDLARKSPKTIERTEAAAATPALADRIRWDWIAAAIAMLLLAWLVTDGEWNFFPQGGFLETFYDAQADSLLHGHIDVTPDSIGTESFDRNGKAYG